MTSRWPIRVCRRAAAHLLYLTVRIGLPLHARLVGYHRSSVGKCIILAPPKQTQTILEGAAFLNTVDPTMFQRLTAERRYIFWYHPKQFLQCRELFSITDNFLHWGNEGVATCFVQSVYEFTLKYLPFQKTLIGSREVAIAARREVQQQVFDWLKKHPFHPELTDQYREFANASSPE